MSLDSYLVDGETVAASVSAYDDKDASTSLSRGTLACTRDRLVFANGKNVTDLSLRSVNAIEYRAPSYPVRYLAYAAPLLLAALVAWTVLPEFIDDTAIQYAITGGGLTGGVAMLLSGLYYMGRHELRVHTPSKSFEFAANDAGLEDVAHAIRAHEP